MATNSKKQLWLLWLALMLGLVAWLANTLVQGKDKTVFMPGQLTDGHHQIGSACETCHQNSFDNREEIVKTCIKCHGDDRVKPYDSHPRQKFTDPRNADRLQKINALNCITCHVEHQPGITSKTGMTQPGDFCVYCHEDIAKDRPSHVDMNFDSCASAGCHNYHNNRALYTDFLIKHLDEPETLDNRQLPQREFATVLNEVATYPHGLYPVKPLKLTDMDKPDSVTSTDEINTDWNMSSHARQGANCTSCHLQPVDDKQPREWISKPDHKACASCHDMEVKHFLRGKHGMRLESGLPAMTPSAALLPMKKESSDTQINCNSCHKAHKYETATAAVDTCLECHNDQHSLAYKQSRHFELWQSEQAGKSPQGTGVSCASCHMPRISYDVSDWLNRVMVQHNQNATLSPNEKMIRPVCMQCHGLEFSIDALADESLLENNFQGKPTRHIQSMDMARKDHLKHQEKSSANE